MKGPAFLFALLVACAPTAALAFEATYTFDPRRSVVRQCVGFSDACEDVKVMGRVALSIDEDAPTATLEVLRFRSDADDFTHRVWSGVLSGSVLQRLGATTTLHFDVAVDRFSATIVAEVIGDAVVFTGGDHRGALDHPYARYAMVAIARPSADLEPSTPIVFIDSELSPCCRGGRLGNFSHLSVYWSGLVTRSFRFSRGPLETQIADFDYVSGERVLALRHDLTRAGAHRRTGPHAGFSGLESVRVTFFSRPHRSEWPLLANHFSYPGEPVAPEFAAIDAILESFIAEVFSPAPTFPPLLRPE
jgi:hypothetical protein